MENHFNLIKKDVIQYEKRLLPRFPFTFLVFKSSSGQTFQVQDISFEGIRFVLKEGEHPYKEEEILTGELHRKGESIKVKLRVKWTKGQSLAGIFVESKNFTDKLRTFLSPQNIAKNIYPLHSTNLSLKLPSNLKYWLKGDGPTEFFIWSHSDGSISSFQIIFNNKVIEWKDGQGTKTGRILDHEDIETPLQEEGEFFFRIDSQPDLELTALANEILTRLPDSYLPLEDRDFLSLKLDTKIKS